MSGLVHSREEVELEKAAAIQEANDVDMDSRVDSFFRSGPATKRHFLTSVWKLNNETSKYRDECIV